MDRVKRNGAIQSRVAALATSLIEERLTKIQDRAELKTVSDTLCNCKNGVIFKFT